MGETELHALKGISLTIQNGEMVAIVGSSGSGKSTLLNIMGCLDRPTEGTCYLDGANVSQLDKNQLAAIRNQRIGFVFQGFNLLGNVSVLANTQLQTQGRRQIKEPYRSRPPGGSYPGKCGLC